MDSCEKTSIDFVPIFGVFPTGTGWMSVMEVSKSGEPKLKYKERNKVEVPETTIFGDFADGNETSDK